MTPTRPTAAVASTIRMTHHGGGPQHVPSPGVTDETRPAGRLSNLSRVPWWIPVALVPWAWFLVRSVHPSMELVAIILPLILLAAFPVTVGLALARRQPHWLIVSGSLALLFVLAVIMPWRPTNGPAPTSSIRVSTMNAGLYFFSDNDAGYFINRREPDLFVGVELTEAHDTEFRSRFPNAVSDILPLERQQQNEEGLQPDGDTYRRHGLPSIGVYSTLDFEVLDDPIADDFPGGLPGYRLQVATDDGPVIVYALHIPRPVSGSGPYELGASDHVALVEAIADAVEQETSPVIMLGDFNAIDRGQSYRRLTENLVDSIRHSGWAVPTADRAIPWSLIFARLDHVLMSDDLCSTNAFSEDTRFSDHRPLVADIGPCPDQ